MLTQVNNVCHYFFREIEISELLQVFRENKFDNFLKIIIKIWSIGFELLALNYKLIRYGSS